MIFEIGDGEVGNGKEVACLAALSTASCSGKSMCAGIQMKVIGSRLSEGNEDLNGFVG